MENVLEVGYIAICPICGWFGKLTKHHALWPRKEWAWHPLRDVLIIWLCRECHDMVHQHYFVTQYDGEVNIE